MSEASRPRMDTINKDTFWALIDQAKEQNPHKPAQWLIKRLEAMGPDQAKMFGTIARIYMELACQFGLWTAAQVMDKGDCSDDGFISFRAWLVGQGKDVYMAALKNPDSLASAPSCPDVQFDFLIHSEDYICDEFMEMYPDPNFGADEHRALKADLKKGIVYGDGISYPYTWSEAAAYLPKLCAKYLMPEDLERRIRQGNDTWNVTNPDILKARATAQKSKKIRRDRGDTR